MLLRLSFPPFRGGDDEKDAVYSRHTGQHILHESPVSGNIDKRNLSTRFQRGVGEPQIDRHTSGLLFRETIGIDAGQGQYQCRLPVIDVTGCRDYRHRTSTPMVACRA
jgi:hypothetical protein